MTNQIDNFLSDIILLEKTNHYSLGNGKIEKDNFATKFRKFVDRKYYTDSIIKIINYLLEKITSFSYNFEMKRVIITLGDKIVLRFSNEKSVKKILLLLDRSLAFLRDKNSFLILENDHLLKKWKKYGLKEEFFYKYPEFSMFLMDSTLALQMKITKDEIKEKSNQPAILVEGKLTKFSDLKNRFDFKYSTKFKEVFVYEKATNEVYTYLDTREGLVKHHPYLNALSPVSKLSRSEYNILLKKAHSFERNYVGKKSDYNGILQIVSSKLEEKNSLFNKSNFFDFLFTPKHPFLRLIDPDTKNVYVIGYWIWFCKKRSIGPLTTERGRFRSPDIWEYKDSTQKLVTNIALNKDEMKRIIYFCKKYVNDDINFGRSIAFNIMNQNCTSFIKSAVRYSLKEDIITNSSLSEMIYEIAPTFLRKVGVSLQQNLYSIQNKTVDVFPSIIKNVY